MRSKTKYSKLQRFQFIFMDNIFRKDITEGREWGVRDRERNSENMQIFLVVERTLSLACFLNDLQRKVSPQFKIKHNTENLQGNNLQNIFCRF